MVLKPILRPLPLQGQSSSGLLPALSQPAVGKSSAGHLYSVQYIALYSPVITTSVYANSFIASDILWCPLIPRC